MKFRQLETDLLVSGQVSFEDIKSAAEAGVKTLICNRVEGEEAGQPALVTLEKEAAELGIAIISVPVGAGHISDEDVTKFAETLQACTKPVLAYCRTGTRSTFLWALSQSGKLPFAEVFATARSAGYDISSIEARYVDPSSLHDIRTSV